MPRQDIMDSLHKYVDPFRVAKGKDFRLKDFDPADTLGLKMDKGEAADLLQRGIRMAGDGAGNALRARIPGPC